MSSDPEEKISLPIEAAEESAESFSFFSEESRPALGGEERAQKEDGQLSVDVLQTSEEVIVVATLAGTRPEDISLHLHNDLLTIRGVRYPPVPAAEYFYEECYWGRFSRTIVLPVEVKAELAKAEYRHGLLVVYLAKTRPANTIPIVLVEE